MGLERAVHWRCFLFDRIVPFPTLVMKVPYIAATVVCFLNSDSGEAQTHGKRNCRRRSFSANSLPAVR